MKTCLYRPEKVFNYIRRWEWWHNMVCIMVTTPGSCSRVPCSISTSQRTSVSELRRTTISRWPLSTKIKQYYFSKTMYCLMKTVRKTCYLQTTFSLRACVQSRYFAYTRVFGLFNILVSAIITVAVATTIAILF